jgi:hypothetical protein
VNELGRHRPPSRWCVAALTLASALAAVAGCSSSSHPPNGAAAPTADTPSAAAAKPDLTQVSKAMLVGATSFPAVPEGAGLVLFDPTLMDPADQMTPSDPGECKPFLDGPDWTQGADVVLTPPGGFRSGGDRSYSVEIALPRQRPDLTKLVGRCRTIKFQAPSDTQARTYSYDLLPSTGVSTPSATVLQFQYHLIRGRLINERGDQAYDDLVIDGVKVIGYDRGIFVAATSQRVPTDPNRVEMPPDDVQAVIKLFNDQVRKLEAA